MTKVRRLVSDLSDLRPVSLLCTSIYDMIVRL